MIQIPLGYFFFVSCWSAVDEIVLKCHFKAFKNFWVSLLFRIKVISKAATLSQSALVEALKRPYMTPSPCKSLYSIHDWPHGWK